MPSDTLGDAARARRTPARGHRTLSNDGGGPCTQTATRKLKPAPRRRRDTENPSPLKPGPHETASATAQPAEQKADPTGRAIEPSVYITHPTHGGGARPSKTQAPTATRLTTPNADQCLHQPREGRGKNRQTPPPKEKGGGGHGIGPQPRSRPPTPQEAGKPPSQTAPKTASTRPPRRNTGGPLTHRKKGHPASANTHLAAAETGKKKTHRRSPNARGWGDGDQKTQERDTQRRTAQSQDRTGPKTTNPPRSPRKKTKGEGGGQAPSTAAPAHPQATGGPPRR